MEFNFHSTVNCPQCSKGELWPDGAVRCNTTECKYEKGLPKMRYTEASILRPVKKRRKVVK